MLKDYYVCSFSGGKDSTAMLLRMIELGTYRIDEVITCDTGMEFPAMYEHIDKVRKIVEDNGIKFTVLKNAKSFECYLYEHKYKDKVGYSWARPRSRWCTRALKQQLISSHFRDIKKTHNIIQYVGLAYDETERLERKNNQSHIHPLADWKWTEQDALNYCYEKGYDWGGLYKDFKRVSCWCCPLQSLDDLRKLYHRYKELWNKLKEFDQKCRTTFRIDYSVEQLEKRFEIEDLRLAQGLTISPYNKEFRELLAKTRQ